MLYKNKKEYLSIYFGLEKIHTYIYGRHVTKQIDHKHIEMILHKPIHTAPSWL